MHVIMHHSYVYQTQIVKSSDFASSIATTHRYDYFRVCAAFVSRHIHVTVVSGSECSGITTTVY